MAPKKKARVSPRAASGETPEISKNTTEEPQSPHHAVNGTEYILQDPWTDEQETSLLKGVIRWKPVGMHRHFRMVAISQHLRNHGHASSCNDHIRIPGIWIKLGSLYDLDALNEREDSIGDIGSDDGDPTKERFSRFRLPDHEFGNMMFSRRLALEGSRSPPLLAHQLFSEFHSTIEDTDVPSSPPALERAAKPSRSSRARGTRASQLQKEPLELGSRRRSKGSVHKSEGMEDGDEYDDVEGHEEGKDAPSANWEAGVALKAAGDAVKKRSGRSGRQR